MHHKRGYVDARRSAAGHGSSGRVCNVFFADDGEKRQPPNSQYYFERRGRECVSGSVYSSTTPNLSEFSLHW